MKRLLVAALCSAALATVPGCNCGGPAVEDGGSGGGTAGGSAAGGSSAGGSATGGGDMSAGGGTGVGGGAMGGGTGGGADSGTGGGQQIVDAGTFDGGCFVLGELCATDTDCCSSFCLNGHCGTRVFCNASDTPCTDSTQCCSGLCLNNTCSANQCLAEGSACTGGAECCTRECGVPAPIVIPDGGADGGPIAVDAGSLPVCVRAPGNNAMCKAIGEPCTDGDAGVGANGCCSTLCRGGFCSQAYVCQANNDSCGHNSECCGAACSVNDGGAGFCQVITGGGSGACLQDGNPCSGLGACCTRECVDLGSGATVCAPSTGCRVAGDNCSSTSQCCGGTPLPNGTVTCDPATKRCGNGTSCSPPGVICGNAKLADGGTYMASANNDCCTGTMPPVDSSGALCRLDSSGVPRCWGGKTTQCSNGYTGTAPCCIAAGDLCEFKDQCCNGAPCLPNADGGAGFFCESRSVCAALGDTCDATSDGGADAGARCCAGSACSAGVCRLPTPDAGTTLPDGGIVDAGIVDAGIPCQANQTSCSGSGQCCSLDCASLDGGALICQPPKTCSQQNQTCTATADCCNGLSCNLPSGSTTGTCQPSLCTGLGQSCAAGSGCCTGLTCVNSAGAACGTTGACTCEVIIQ